MSLKLKLISAGHGKHTCRAWQFKCHRPPSERPETGAGQDEFEHARGVSFNVHVHSQDVIFGSVLHGLPGFRAGAGRLGSSATSPAAGAVTGAAGSSTASAGGGSTGGSGLGSGGGSTASSGGSATGAIATTSSVSGDATGGLVTTLGNTVSTVGTQLSSTGSTTGGPLGAIVDGLGGTVTQTGDLLSGTGSTLTTSGLTGLPVVGPTVTGVADAVDPVTNALADVTVLNTSTGSSTVTPLLSANVLSTSPQPNAPVQVGVLSNGQVVQLKV
ncbi:hypothetical protein APM_0565, partial [Acidiphilium sp. PM]